MCLGHAFVALLSRQKQAFNVLSSVDGQTKHSLFYCRPLTNTLLEIVYKRLRGIRFLQAFHPVDDKWGDYV